MADKATYTLKRMEKPFWKKVKVHAADNDISIKGLIIKLLNREIEKAGP